MARHKKTDGITGTVQAITAGLDVPKMPEAVNDKPKTITKTAEIVNESTENVNEATVLPAAIDLEPKTLSIVQEFKWNFDEIKQSLAGKIERYTGLVVNDDNLKDMERTQKEIASLRTKIGKFRLQVKRELEKPYAEFELQIKELLALVESVERPIKEQLEVYENKRREEKALMVQEIINEVARQLGLEGKYSSQIAIADRWLNRTITKKEIIEEIEMKAAWFLDIQTKEREAEFFRKQKIEMAKFMCEQLSAGLATPLKFEEIESRIDAMDIMALKAYIETEVEKRREREDRAAQLAIERAETAKAAPSVQPAPPAMPPIQFPAQQPYSPKPTKWNVVLKLPGIDFFQAQGFKDYLIANKIAYEVVSQEAVE
ncbi:MAG: DUF1351 domain-containing protein [Negativicutes bacterium]|nr:DUF1351 domain-containing protein [Negativicutes bacterium]